MVTVALQDDGTFLATDLPDDGTLAVVMEWRRWPVCEGKLVVRNSHCLVILGLPKTSWVEHFFAPERDYKTCVRLRLLKPGELMDLLKVAKE